MSDVRYGNGDKVPPENRAFMSVSEELIRLTLAWPVSTIDGEPSLTRGSLTIGRDSGGGFLLSVTAGDENFPDGDEIQFPLSAAHALLVQQALSGEILGDIEE